MTIDRRPDGACRKHVRSRTGNRSGTETDLAIARKSSPLLPMLVSCEFHDAETIRLAIDDFSQLAIDREQVMLSTSKRRAIIAALIDSPPSAVVGKAQLPDTTTQSYTARASDKAQS